LPHIILPIGISFFTFTQIAFLVDSYKGEVKEYSLLHYILFVTYFPHLLAGPILHHKEMMPQFSNKWNFSLRWRNVSLGLFLFSIGLFKKVILADSFAVWANPGFSTETVLTLIDAWTTSLSYTLQLYFDFSGYVDMAIGMSLMFNIRLPLNFNSPYKAKDIQDFWRRWHITLSRFLRDYIYIPLGGNKVSKYRNYVNLFSVFFIGGIWHGASWMFVIWGILHGGAIVIHRIWKDFGLRMWGWLGWLITFNFVNVAWVFFRADDLDTAQNILIGMSGLNGIGTEGFKELAILLIFIMATVVLRNSNDMCSTFKPTRIYQILTGTLLFAGIVMLERHSEFLYFRF
jgi:D-alanyl-lipoteichoic acid acyltransferase DltB (MBOAT superfamily)